MYQFLGLRKNMETIALLSKPYLTESQNLSLDTLKRAYQAYLRTIQAPDSVSSSISVEFISDRASAEKLMPFFSSKSHLDDLFQATVLEGAYEEGEADRIMTRIREAFEFMSQVCGELATLFSLTVNYCFLTKSSCAGGGSTSGAIGVIWINPKPEWTRQDYLEFFIHELTHQLVFLDERRYGHYVSYTRLAEPATYAQSSILRKARPLDKVVHSLVVATEVLLTRERLLGHPVKPFLHPSTPQMLQSCDATLESLLSGIDSNDLIKTRAVTLIELCELRLQELNLISISAGT